MNNPTCIYALADPNKPSEIRYIGKTRSKLRGRLFQHVNGVNRYACHRSAWIKSLLKEGRIPMIWPLEFIPEEIWQERERFWVKFFRPLGLLTNHDDGGRGCHRMPPTKEETRIKMSAARKGKKWTPEVRERVMKIWSGNKRTQRQMDQFWEMIRTRKPRVYTEEGRAKRRVSARNRPVTKRQIDQVLEMSKKTSHPVKCTDTGIVYKSLSEAARQYGSTASKLVDAIKRGGTFRKLRWELIPKEIL